MKRDYIPEKDAAFNGWLASFTKYIESHYAELGLSATDKDNIVAANTGWKTGYQAHMTAQGAARGAKEKKDSIRKTAESLARNLAQRSTVYPGTTDGHRAGMGMRPLDTNPTPTAPEYVGTLEPPLLVLDWSLRSQVVIHFGVNPANEKENSKPADIAGVKLWFRRKGEDWQFLADDTNSPYTHNLSDIVPIGAQAGLGITEPQNVEYKAQWFDKKMRLGSFGQTAKCTVTP
ncbi:MAG: hypothetical protein HZA49_04965 [Planctomycetes bacterium]|nr:hypothetical protein [Planctomycetota bacterium]